MYIIGLAPTPSFTTFGVTRFIGTRVAPFHPEVVLFTVTTLGIILGGYGFETFMVWALVFGPVAVNGVVTYICSTGVTPIFPLAPWATGVTTNSTPSGVFLYYVLGALELVLDHTLEQAFQFVQAIVNRTVC